MKPNYTGRVAFLLSDHNYDMENAYLYWPGCSVGVSWVFSSYFMGLQEYLKIISRVFYVIVEYETAVPRVF